MKLSHLGCALLAFATPAAAQQATTPRPVITVCKALYQPPIATYTATIKWNEPILYYGGQLVVGLSDSSGKIIVQGLTGSRLGTGGVNAAPSLVQVGVDTLSFRVADTAHYPFDAAVYSMSPTAYRNYTTACAANACFFSATGDGIIRLTKTVRLQSAALMPACPPQPILFEYGP